MNPKSIWWSAITDDAGEVDVGYLALIWGCVGWGSAVIVILAVGAFTALREPGTGSDTIQSMGVAVGAISGGFATMLGAVGLFRMGDKPDAATTTTTVQATQTTVAQDSESGPG